MRSAERHESLLYHLTGNDRLLKDCSYRRMIHSCMQAGRSKPFIGTRAYIIQVGWTPTGNKAKPMIHLFIKVVGKGQKKGETCMSSPPRIYVLNTFGNFKVLRIESSGNSPGTSCHNAGVYHGISHPHTHTHTHTHRVLGCVAIMRPAPVLE